jgi:hypothetical protein
VYAQTIYYEENLKTWLSAVTVAHLVGFLSLPWFSSILFVYFLEGVQFQF